MSVHSEFDDAVTHNGWNEERQTEVLLDFIEENSDPEEFREYLEERSSREESYGE